MKGNLISTTINLMGITHIEVHYNATLYAVLLCSAMPVSRVTLVIKNYTTSKFKAYVKDLGAKVCKAPLSIKNGSSSHPILTYKYSNPT